MSLFGLLDVSASGLAAQRLRLDLVANNMANLDSTRTVEGGPYQRQLPILAPRKETSLFARLLSGGQEALPVFEGGVQVAAIVRDPSPPRILYDPGHPQAGADGNVLLPNVDLVAEMIDLLAATRAYEANLAVFNTAKETALRTLEMGRA
ncbi:MAG: flagellar basal body rod protein FlgC [Firmicutes bacterium]|nr:flagellar basal body rod protein FlgC [Bacillota bacterium]